MAGNLFKNITKLDATPELEGEVEGLETEFVQEEADTFEETDTVDSEVGELNDLGDDLEQASVDHDTLTENAEAIEESLNDPDSEGISEVTALSLRTSLRILRNNHALSFPRLEGTVTKQSFVGNSRSTNIERSRIVLAGIKDAIIELWEKIKAGLKLLWNKIVAFWDKHFSTVGRLKKSFDSAYKKIKSLKGAPDYTKDIKAGSSLNNVYQNGKELDIRVIDNEFTRLGAASEQVALMSVGVAAAGSFLAKSITSGKELSPSEYFSLLSFKGGESKLEFGSENEPLVGGLYATIETKAPEDEDTAPTYELEFNQASYSGEEDRKVVLASKDQLAALFKKSSEYCSAIMKHAKNMEKLAKEHQKLIDDINKGIEKANTDDNKEAGKELTSFLKSYQRISVIDGKMDTKFLAISVKALKANLAFGKLCMKAYKKSK